jgi:hypothetical protein
LRIIFCAADQVPELATGVREENELKELMGPIRTKAIRFVVVRGKTDRSSIVMGVHAGDLSVLLCLPFGSACPQTSACHSEVGKFPSRQAITRI